MNRRRIALAVVVCLLQILPLFAMAETDGNRTKSETESGLSWLEVGSVEITVGGVPVQEVLGTAGGMLKDAVEENVGEAIGQLNGIFGQFAEEMSGDLKEIEGLIGSMMEDTWILKIPAVSFDTVIMRSSCESALELYKAQLSGEIGKESRIALNPKEGCSNSIVYIYDEGNILPAIREAVESGRFGENEIIFGREGFTGTYEVSAVMLLTPSAEATAICDMTDLSDETQFEAYRNYVSEYGAKDYNVSFEYGDQIVTIVFWNEDASADWLAVVAREVPFMLE